jgi:hypothetical protein
MNKVRGVAEEICVLYLKNKEIYINAINIRYVTESSH